ncbi:MAG: chemotaxis protein CheD [Halanaeroarchaeum sp.]
MHSKRDERIRVGVADLAATNGHRVLVTSGLGSCVGVALYDDGGVGGLLHAMLPAAPPDAPNPAKFVDAGIRALLEEMADNGAKRGTIRAKLTGGSSMLNLGNGQPVGEKNVEAAIDALATHDIELVADETGGDAGRSVAFHPDTGVLEISRVNAEVTEI